tara:strand:- start:67 stop:219 length:153 start_codon:yes stop_codon:yes gene_type:complete
MINSLFVTHGTIIPKIKRPPEGGVFPAENYIFIHANEHIKYACIPCYSVN